MRRIREVTSDALSRNWKKMKKEKKKHKERTKEIAMAAREATRTREEWNPNVPTVIGTKTPIVRSFKHKNTVWGTHRNGHVYRRLNRGVVAWLHDPKLFQNQQGWNEGEESCYFESIDNTLRPSPMQLRYLFETVFCTNKVCRTHEVMMMWGKNAEGVWAAFVPPQKVGRTNVRVMDTEAVAGFQTQFTLYGDMHSHPWQGRPSASGTDMDDMKKKTGLYAIVSSEGEVQWYVALDGHVQKADQWDLLEWPAENMKIMTKNGGTIEEQFERETVQVSAIVTRETTPRFPWIDDQTANTYTTTPAYRTPFDWEKKEPDAKSEWEKVFGQESQSTPLWLTANELTKKQQGGIRDVSAFAFDLNELRTVRLIDGSIKVVIDLDYETEMRCRGSDWPLVICEVGPVLDEYKGKIACDLQSVKEKK